MCADLSTVVHAEELTTTGLFVGLHRNSSIVTCWVATATTEQRYIGCWPSKMLLTPPVITPPHLTDLTVLLILGTSNVSIWDMMNYEYCDGFNYAFMSSANLIVWMELIQPTLACKRTLANLPLLKKSKAPGSSCLDQNMQIAVKPNGEH